MVTMATAPSVNRLSGLVLPLILRKKLKEQSKILEATKEENADSKGETETAASAIISDDLHPTAGASIANRVFTAEELEEKIWRAKLGMQEIQKQLHRGEETYHEETHTHGNLFKGWDVFIDLKQVGGEAAVGRRIPHDNRWFSNSCTSIGRINPSRPMQLSTRNLTPEDNMDDGSSSVRSETNTSLPAPSTTAGNDTDPTAIKAEPGGIQEKRAALEKPRVYDLSPHPLSAPPPSIPQATPTPPTVSSNANMSQAAIHRPAVESSTATTTTNPTQASAGEHSGATPLAAGETIQDDINTDSTVRKTRKRKAGE